MNCPFNGPFGFWFPVPARPDGITVERRRSKRDGPAGVAAVVAGVAVHGPWAAPKAATIRRL